MKIKDASVIGLAIIGIPMLLFGLWVSGKLPHIPGLPSG